MGIFRQEMMKLFGNSFEAGSRILVILAFGQLVNGFAGPTGLLLLMTGKQRWEVLNSVVVITVSVVLNLILIPKFGIEGAALSSAVSLCSVNVLKVLETYHEFGFHRDSVRYLKGIFAITFGAVATFLLHGFLGGLQLNFILILMIGSFSLFVVSLSIYCLFQFDKEDRLILNRVAVRLGL